MRIVHAAILGLTVLLAACEQQKSGLAAASDAMGATALNSIEYSGSGSNFGFGQAYQPGDPWPKFRQVAYKVSANYQTPAYQLDATRAQGEVPPHGGAAQPVAGEQRTVLAAAGKNAWAQNGEQATPQNENAADRMRELWATPQGVIKAAMAANAALNGKEIDFKAEGRDVKATLNDQNLVEKVSFLSTNEVIGDYPIEIAYSDYADFGGVKFPTHIVRTEDGSPTLDVRITDVKPNAAVTITAPQNVVSAPPPPENPVVTSEKLADGVWYLNVGGARSWAVDFKDYIVVVEGIASEARSLAVNEEIAKLIPNKQIKYVINTHPHYDHAGGLRTYVAQGATVVTHEGNKAFFEKVWARPRTLAPDLLSKQPKEATFETLTDKKVMTDGNKTIELYHMIGGHNGNNLLVYLPKEGIIFWGDGYNPPNGDDPRDFGRTPEYGIDLYRNIEQLGLKVKTIAPAHGAGARPYDNLKKAIGVIPVATAG